MGKGYDNIILVTDGTKTYESAAQTALNLAKQHSAKVLVVDTVRPPSFAASWFNSNAEELFEIVVADKRERLEKVADVMRDGGVEAKVEILFGKSSEEIAKTALTEKADLVVRYMKGPQSRHASPFGTTARNLMRVCPCPLLLVADKPVSDAKVVACVNAEHDFNENEAIVVEAENVSGRNEDLMALYCWKFYGPEYLREYMDEKTVKAYMDQAEQNYRGLFDQFLEKHDMNAFGKGVHLQNGDPTQVIPDVCRHESIDVAVMSSASQNHPLNRLLGSTVESVLEDLPCALLVVKPLGFKSPIKPSRSKVDFDSV